MNQIEENPKRINLLKSNINSILKNCSHFPKKKKKKKKKKTKKKKKNKKKKKKKEKKNQK